MDLRMNFSFFFFIACCFFAQLFAADNEINIESGVAQSRQEKKDQEAADRKIRHKKREAERIERVAAALKKAEEWLHTQKKERQERLEHKNQKKIQNKVKKQTEEFSSASEMVADKESDVKMDWFAVARKKAKEWLCIKKQEHKELLESKAQKQDDSKSINQPQDSLVSLKNEKATRIAADQKRFEEWRRREEQTRQELLLRKTQKEAEAKAKKEAALKIKKIDLEAEKSLRIAADKKGAEELRFLKEQEQQELLKRKAQKKVEDKAKKEALKIQKAHLAAEKAGRIAASKKKFEELRLVKEQQAQFDQEVKNEVKKQLYLKSQLGFEKKKDLCGLSIAWPIQVIPFEKNNFFRANIAYKNANQSYDEKGKVVSLSSLLFASEDIAFTDLLLTEKLVSEGAFVTPPSSETYLAKLKNQNFRLKASFNEIKTDLQYVRHFKGQDVALGISLPVVWRQNRLKFSSPYVDLSTEIKVALLGGTFESLMRDILAARGLTAEPITSRTGFGDLDLFATFQLYSKNLKNAFVGAKITVPTGKSSDVSKVWPVELGNGGFTGVSLYASAVASFAGFINPNIFAQATYFIPTSLLRRVPKFRSEVAGVTLDASYYGFDDFNVSGDSLLAHSFTALDTPIAQFAENSAKVTVHRFPELVLHVGNTFEKFILRNSCLDLFYNLRIKGKDRLGGTLPTDVWQTSALLNRTSQIEQMVGGQFSYRFDDMVCMELKGEYTFAGRYVPRTYSIGTIVTVDF